MIGWKVLLEGTLEYELMFNLKLVGFDWDGYFCSWINNFDLG